MSASNRVPTSISVFVACGFFSFDRAGDIRSGVSLILLEYLMLLLGEPLALR